MIITPQCTFCKHFRGFQGLQGLCNAFPDGIPMSILNNQVDHKLPYLDDHGIRWEQSEDTLEDFGPIDLFPETERPEPVLSNVS